MKIHLCQLLKDFSKKFLANSPFLDSSRVFSKDKRQTLRKANVHNSGIESFSCKVFNHDECPFVI